MINYYTTFLFTQSIKEINGFKNRYLKRVGTHEEKILPKHIKISHEYRSEVCKFFLLNPLPNALFKRTQLTSK